MNKWEGLNKQGRRGEWGGGGGGGETNILQNELIEGVGINRG